MSGLGVRVTLYETAGEAVIAEAWHADSPTPSVPLVRTAAHERSTSPARPDVLPPPLPGEAAPPTAAARAERRARGKVRRYGVANGCTRLLTLTNADQTHSPRVMLGRLAEFQRRLRESHPDLAWVRTLERHESGAIHAHYGLSTFVDFREIRRLWRHGIIDVRKIRTKRGGREDARIAARYIAKYVSKDAVRDGLGGHRYEVRQGRQPRTLIFWARDLEDARATAETVMGYEAPTYAWSSSGEPDWAGPPSAFLSW